MEYVIQVECDLDWRDEFIFHTIEDAEAEFHETCKYFYGVRLIQRSLEVLKVYIYKP